jgi:hypothetical protein
LKEIEEFHARQVWQRRRTDGICKILESGCSSSLWAQELSFEHLLEIARIHIDRQQEAFYLTHLGVLPSYRCHAFPIVQPALWHTLIPSTIGIERYTESKENVRRERGTEEEEVDKEEGENGEGEGEEKEGKEESRAERMENGGNDRQLGKKDKVTKYVAWKLSVISSI